MSSQINTTPTGISIGEANKRVGLYGAAGAVRRTGSAQAVVTQTSATVTTANGSDAGTTETLANALKVQLNAAIADLAAHNVIINELRAALVGINAIKGSA